MIARDAKVMCGGDGKCASFLITNMLANVIDEELSDYEIQMLAPHLVGMSRWLHDELAEHIVDVVDIMLRVNDVIRELGTRERIQVLANTFGNLLIDIPGESGSKPQGKVLIYGLISFASAAPVRDEDFDRIMRDYKEALKRGDRNVM